MPASSNPMPSGVRFFLSRIFPLIIVVIGASVAFAGIRGLVRASASDDWPTVQGTVVASGVELHYNSQSKGNKTSYDARIRYAFKVDGTAFKGKRVAYGDYGSSNPSHARDIVNRYPTGRHVTVHYMPGHPEESVLEAGLKDQSWYLPGIGVLLLIVGGLMALRLPKVIGEQERKINFAGLQR